MLPSNIELLNHILEEVSFVLSAVKEKSKDQVINDPVLSRAIVRSLEIIAKQALKLTLILNLNIHMWSGEKCQICEIV
jgi:uncharacterized protein with HEPN domain